MIKKLQRSLLVGMVSAVIPAAAIDNPHYYRARLWMNQEPRYAKPWLQTFDSYFSGGDTTTGYNACGKKVPLLAIHGNENLNALGIKTPGIKKSCNQAFFSGDFSITEIQLHAYSNFDYGFFAHVALPIRNIHINDITPHNVCHLDNNRAWEQSLVKLDSLLKKNKLCISSFHESGVGDFSILGGWTYSHYDCPCDFIDATVQTGVLFPTARKKSLHNPFSVPLGYNGHYAVPLIGDCAIGVLNWLNLGAHAESLFFFDATQCVRLKTNKCQEGFIRLAEDKARVKEGTIWNLTVYLKADHFTHGTSFLLGYSFDHQNRSHVTPFSKRFNRKIANDDPLLESWSMGVFHTTFEYDWSNDDNPYGPRLGFEYNHVLHGQNVFRTGIAGGWVGLNMEWNF